MNDLTHLSLFTGIGGIDLAAEWAGFQTVGQCENNPYALRVLRNRFGRRIPRWTDVHTLTADDFKRRTGIDSPTIITGGFPCQPFSCAGKRRGKEDDRHLWPEMFRVVRELRPAWVLGENVAGIVNMELESCCADLESEGYTLRAFLVPACGVGALHRRERVFIVAYTERDNDRRRSREFQETDELQAEKRQEKRFPKSCGSSEIFVANTNHTGSRITRFRPDGNGKTESEKWRWIPGSQPCEDDPDVSNTSIEGERGLYVQPRKSRQTNNDAIRSGQIMAITDRKRLERKRSSLPEERRQNERGPVGLCYRSGREQWAIEPPLGRVANGVPHRVDRLRCLGNAVVPQQVYPILAGIAQIEQEISNER